MQTTPASTHAGCHNVVEAQAEVLKIQSAMEKKKKLLDALKNQLQEDIQAIGGHQKRIKVADRSELGWAEVKAYNNNELAIVILRMKSGCLKWRRLQWLKRLFCFHP